MLTLELLCHLRFEKRKKKKRERNKTDKRENETGERQGVSGVSPYSYTGQPTFDSGTTTGYCELSPPASCDSTRSLPPKSIGLSRLTEGFSVLCSATQARLRYGMHMRDRGTATGNSRPTFRSRNAENSQIEKFADFITRKIWLSGDKNLGIRGCAQLSKTVKLSELKNLKKKYFTINFKKNARIVSI